MSSTVRTRTQSTQASQAHRVWHSVSHAAPGSVALGVVTVVGSRLHADPVAVALLYVFVVVLTSLRAGLAPALIVSIIAIFCLDYFFTPPVFALSIGEIDAVAVIVFGGTAFLIAHLTSRLRTSFQDVQRSEASLREQGSLLELTHDTVFVRDMNDVITYWNRAAEDLYRWTREEALGKVSHQLMQTIFPAPLADINAALLRTGRWEGELIHTKRDGTPVVVASRWSLQRDGHQPLAILETNNDITERKRAEAELRQSEEQWRDVFENNPTMYFMVDDAGIVVSVNPFGAEQLGYTVHELVGQPVLNVFDQADRESVAKHIATCLEQLGRTTSWEARKVRKDGMVLWVRETAKAVARVSGPIVLVACEDLTEQRRAEEALRRAQADLAHVSRVTTLGEMAASIAHEVDQPLSGVVINANACLRFLTGVSPNLDEVHDGLQAIARDGRRASDVIARIRALARRTATEKELLDINEVIREVVALAEGEARRTRASVRTDLAVDLPPVLGDRVQLQQVVLNLLLNGLEAMQGVAERPHELAIRTHLEAADRVRVAVQDSGSGIDPARTRSIFDAFYTTKHDGMGMGLSISRSIVEQHGGRLWAEPNDGPGTTFHFTV